MARNWRPSGPRGREAQSLGLAGGGPKVGACNRLQRARVRVLAQIWGADLGIKSEPSRCRVLEAVTCSDRGVLEEGIIHSLRAPGSFLGLKRLNQSTSRYFLKQFKF
ncbi:hypothetical protein J6590_062144 [Homalodisca vitripennis]|nr:hypothetical protein J6590_062144 [Homalodisca vitripennis]